MGNETELEVTTRLLVNCGLFEGPRVITHHITHEKITTIYINAVINAMLIVPTTVLNLSVIMVLLRPTFFTVSNVSLLFLSIWGLLSSILSQPLYICYVLYLSERRMPCTIALPNMYLGPTISMSNTFTGVAISIERYLALFHTYYWQQNVRPKHLVICLSTVWVLPFILCVVMFDTPYRGPGVALYTLITIFALAWISYSHFKVHRLVRSMQRQISRNTVVPFPDEKEATRKRQARLSKFTVVVIGVFLGFNIPYCALSLLVYVLLKGFLFAENISICMQTFLCISPLVYPLVFAWQSPQVGRELLKLWRIRSG